MLFVSRAAVLVWPANQEILHWRRRWRGGMKGEKLNRVCFNGFHRARGAIVEKLKGSPNPEDADGEPRSRAGTGDV